MPDEEEKTPSAEIKPLAAFAATCPTCGRVVELTTHHPEELGATARLVAESAPHEPSGCGSYLVLSVARTQV